MRNGYVLLAALLLPLLAPLEASAQRALLVQPERRAWLGFSYEPVTRTERAVTTGVVVRDVVSASPAERAGVQVGDTILSINGIGATPDFIGSLGTALSPGDEVKVELRRAGRTRELTVVAARPPADYVGLGPSAGLLRFDGDSIRSLVRVFVDSAAASIDSLRLPDVFVERGVMRLRGARGDSAWTFMFGDSVLFRGDSARMSVFRFQNDSLRVQMDSLRMRLSVTPFQFELRRDSILTALRDRPGAVFITPDSVLSWRTDLAPFGITMLGRSAIAGAELTRLDPGMEEYFGVREGVLVTRVPPDTPAARAGLRPGDVIVSVNGESVATVEALRMAILRTPGDGPARLGVSRKRQSLTLELKRD